MSACGRCAASASRRITEAGRPSAMRSARLVLRFAMMRRPIFCACRWRAASSIISPAPTRSAVCRSKPANTRRASRMPAEATETALAPIAVSRPHALGHREGGLEQAVQLRAGRACLLRGAVGILELAEDLRLAEDQ